MAKGKGQAEVRPEVVFALVGALGANLELLSDTLSELVSDCGYNARLIRVSMLLHEFEKWKGLPTEPIDLHIEKHQKAGNEFRKILRDGGAMASLAISAIRKERSTLQAALHGGEARSTPAGSTAYIVRSLKNPDEVQRLKYVYGSSVLVLAGFSPRNARVERLSQQIAESHSSFTPQEFLPKAETLINTDEAELGNRFGQNVRDTYPHADAFFDLTDPKRLRDDLARFVEILFGHPFHTPTRAEYVMFHARAAALRSSDLSRQVGAAIATSDGQVIAVGCNEVPKAGGGSYWEGDSPDYRDFALERDFSAEMKRQAVMEVVDTLHSKNWLASDFAALPPGKRARDTVALLRRTRIMNVGEFGRTVHAEMAALLEASRRGVSVKGEDLYVTTFPCHNCARHIIASGIKKVVYIEPYPKSLARTLHMDSIVFEAETQERGKIAFLQFVGVSPARYFDFFNIGQRTDTGGKPRRWSRTQCAPRFSSLNAHLSYIPKEQVMELALSEGIRKAKLLAVRSGRPRRKTR